jgi:hypothetical protein
MMCHHATVYIGCQFWELAQIGAAPVVHLERARDLPD